jgi:hypothetical protein
LIRLVLTYCYAADLFEISCRTSWPFHIHNPEIIMKGTKTNRVADA